MYVCMYVRMYVSMYVRTCIYAFIPHLCAAAFGFCLLVYANPII
jgi:hypothetical protein